MSTHKPTADDTTLLLQGLGFFALLLALIVAIEPSYIFAYSIPLGVAGAILLALPLSGKFQRIMRLDFDKGDQKAPGVPGGRRQPRWRSEQRKRKRKMK